MKYFRIIAVLGLSVSLLTSCDFVRSILGKPTSEDLKRLKLEQAARQKAVRDSIAAEQAAKEAASQSSPVKKSRYYVILGSFCMQSNVDKFSSMLSSLGYEVQIFAFRNGLQAVGVAGTDDFQEASSKIPGFMEKEFIVDDYPWVYDSQTMKL